jgi:cysteine desulfurase/selenocysteine lyase
MLSVESRQQDFPRLANRTYLNTAAESVPPLCVKEALDRYWLDKLDGMDGREAHFQTVEDCREVTSRFLNTTPAEVSFCSCSAEACNMLYNALQLQSGDEVVLNDLDFPSGATPWLSPDARCKVNLWKSLDGVLHVSDLAELVNEKTRLVHLSLVSFINGHRIQMAPVVDVVREKAPKAILSVDVTQALGRIGLDVDDADFLVSSTHKWALGIHGGGIVGIRQERAAELSVRMGGWHNIENAFNPDRFERVVYKKGAAGYSTGMPSFAPLYALNASLRYLENIGVARISAHADPLVLALHDGLCDRGIVPMCPVQKDISTGIVAITHSRSEEINKAFVRENIHAMVHMGRIRFALHGYNTQDDVDRALSVLDQSSNEESG